MLKILIASVALSMLYPASLQAACPPNISVNVKFTGNPVTDIKIYSDLHAFFIAQTGKFGSLLPKYDVTVNGSIDAKTPREVLNKVYRYIEQYRDAVERCKKSDAVRPPAPVD